MADESQISTCSLSLETHTGFLAMERLRQMLLSLSLVEGSSVEDIVGCCLEQMREMMAFEYYAIYVLDNVGVMRKVKSLDTYLVSAGSAVTLSSLTDDAWNRLLPRLSTNARYRDLTVVPAMELEPDDPLKQAFSEVDRKLTGVVRLPLNGSSSTFGFIEAANRLDAPIDHDSGNMRRFLYVASALASAITTWRARRESFALASVAKVLSESESNDKWAEDDPDSIFSVALEAGVSRLTDYRAAVV